MVSASATSGTPSVYFDDVTMAPVTAPNPVVTWGQTFGYDGFGNLLSETPTAGSAPHLNINVDTATNRVVATGVQYDAAGNMTNDGTQAYSYDEANRLKTAGNYFYTYSGLESKRVIAYNANGSTPSATINLYSPDGKRLGYYGFSSTNGWSKTNSGSFQNFLYLGNKALTYTEDRIGSAGNYFPYGNGYNATGAEGQAFGTYVQDESGLLYADQRYYNPGFGRFMTADRSNANIDYGNPTSWNRYAYTNGDPVNGMDPSGLAEKDGVSPPGDPTQGPGGIIGADTSGDYSGSSGSDGAPDYSVTVVALSSTAPTAALANAWNALSNAVTAVQNNPIAQLGAGLLGVGLGFFSGNGGEFGEGISSLEEGAGGLEQGTVTLYRVVQSGELQNIVDSGAYSLNSEVGGIVKGFYPTANQGSMFAQSMFNAFPGEGPYTLTSTTVPGLSLPPAIPVLGEGPAYFLETMPSAPVCVYNCMPTPH